MQPTASRPSFVSPPPCVISHIALARLAAPRTPDRRPHSLLPSPAQRPPAYTNSIPRCRTTPATLYSPGTVLCHPGHRPDTERRSQLLAAALPVALPSPIAPKGNNQACCNYPSTPPGQQTQPSCNNKRIPSSRYWNCRKQTFHHLSTAHPTPTPLTLPFRIRDIHHLEPSHEERSAREYRQHAL